MLASLERKSMVKKIIAKTAAILRGKDFQLDERIPTWALINISIARSLSLVRCLLTGLVFSINPKKLVFLGRRVVISNRSLISFGRGVTISDGCIIDGLSSSGISIGDGVSIGPYSILKATGSLTDVGVGITIGAGCGFDAYTFFGGAGGIVIGRNVICGQHVSFHAENHTSGSTTIPIKAQGTTRQGIKVSDDCWIGANVTVLDGCNIGRGSIIGAGSVVRGDIPPFSVVVGVPGRVVRKRSIVP